MECPSCGHRFAAGGQVEPDREEDRPFVSEAEDESPPPIQEEDGERLKRSFFGALKSRGVRR
jgi:hypothetical protein